MSLQALKKFSVCMILRGQFSSMRVVGKNALDTGEIALLFGMPIVLAMGLLLLGTKISESLAGTIISAASIFAGLLLNLLVLLYSLLPADTKSDSQVGINESIERTLTSYTFYNISFAILVSVFLVISCLFVYVAAGCWVKVSTFACGYFGAQLFLSVAQILKRCHTLLEYRMQIKTKEINHWDNSTK